MKAIERFKHYRDVELDKILIDIRNGTIKCGRYAHLVKVDPDKKIKGKVLFKNEKSSDSE